MENTVKKSATYGDWTIDFMSDKKLVIKKNGEVCNKVRTEAIAIANAKLMIIIRNGVACIWDLPCSKSSI